MNLVRLIYTSRFSQSVTTKDLQDILERSRSKNPSYGITGALSYSPGWFLQALEGPAVGSVAAELLAVQDVLAARGGQIEE